MKNITVVTTFHKPGLDLYGQRFLDSFAERVDKRIKMLVYVENCNPRNPDPEQIFFIDAKDALPKLKRFKKKWSKVPKANGIPPEEIKRRRPADHRKTFKWDAVRFANKVYAVFNAAARSTGWCVWMDADTYVHSDWSYEDFSGCLPDDCWITFVGRGKGSQSWPECGFYGLNMDCNITTKFLEEFEIMYENAETGIFKLDEWHDSYVFGKLLKKYSAIDSNFHDYSADVYVKTARTGGGGHPLVNGPLGEWIDHMKGNRKEFGKTKLKDLFKERKETYWQTDVEKKNK